MTDHGLARELSAGNRTRAQDGRDRRASPPPIATSEILAVCDRELREVGRRNHLFGWLRRPGKADAWLPVDAYYPRSRVVVVHRLRERPDDHIYRERVPAHGLRLLEITPADLGRSRADAERALAAMLAALAPPPATEESRRSQPAHARTPAGGEREGLPAADRASRFLAARAARAGRRPARAPAQRASPLVGVAVAVGLVLLLVFVTICVLSIVGG